MANLAPSVLRQASRLATKSTISAAPRRSVRTLSRVATTTSARRSYATETKPREHAQVQTDHAIRLDSKEFDKGGLSIRSGQDASPEHVSPMAGKKLPRDACRLQLGYTMLTPNTLFPDVLSHATKMDEGQRPIYLDMQATTPLDPRVLDAMLPFYTGFYGNPHSRTHAYGWESEKAVEDAREHIAALIGADPKEIIFTSGATESNNMSIKGVARFFGRGGKKKHIITTQTEHKCVLDSCRHLQDEGYEVTYLPVNSNGLIDLEKLKEAIRPDTMLVSIMSVNNEIGVIQPIAEIGKLCRENKVFFHTDAAQAVGKIPMDVNAMNIDLMSISAHKIYGPKGIGACYVRRRPRVRLDPIISGGGQERGLRSGTLAPALVVGFGEACRIAKKEMEVCFQSISPFSVQTLTRPP